VSDSPIDWHAIQVMRQNRNRKRKRIRNNDADSSPVPDLCLYYKLKVSYTQMSYKESYKGQNQTYSVETRVFQLPIGNELNYVVDKNQTMFIEECRMKYDNLILNQNSKLVLIKDDDKREHHSLHVNCVSSIRLGVDAHIDVNACGRAFNPFRHRFIDDGPSNGRPASRVAGGAGFVNAGKKAELVCIDRRCMSAIVITDDELVGNGGTIDRRSNIRNVFEQTVIGNCGGSHS
jgi:hypothetical protein